MNDGVGNVVMQVRHVHECVEVCRQRIGQAGKQHGAARSACVCMHPGSG